MKRILFNILLLSSSLTLTAQDFHISFQPKESGTTIDSILVTNQVTGQKVKLAGTEQLLLHVLGTGISEINRGFEKGMVYPNPSDGVATLAFSTERNEMVTTGLYSAAGQLLYQVRQQLEPGTHRFRIGFPAPGIYAVSVTGENRTLGLRAFYTGTQSNGSFLVYQGSENNTAAISTRPVKSATLEKTMDYRIGELLLYSAFSKDNNIILTDSPAATKVYTLEFVACTDYEKQNYPVVKIGTQWWMAASLQSTKYRDGTPIPNVTDKSAWAALTTGGYCWYNNDEKNRNRFGALYNGYAVTDNHGLCPAGWHVPTDAEWTTLENWLISNGHNYDGSIADNKIAKSLAAASGWEFSGIQGAAGNTDYPTFRNKSGFSALPGGGRASNGTFDIMGSWGMWWTSSTASANDLWVRYLGNTEVSLDRFPDPQKTGYSVRCLKNSE